MAEIALRQIKAIIAVCEEGSFTRARRGAGKRHTIGHFAARRRRRAHARASKLFERSAAGVKPDAGGPALLQALRRAR